MADQNDPRQPRGDAPQGAGTQVAGTPVPDLIERYRVRRDAWIAQADELARLRDEVRGAAEREAMEIVTAARRDVRQVIMEARRELLVLSAQVQAALGEVAGKDPAALLKAHAPAVAAGLPSSSTSDHSADILVPEAAVKTMLDEARADMEALAQDAKTVPFQATTQFLSEQPPVPPRPPSTFEVPAPAAFESVKPKVVFETLHTNTFEAVAADPIESTEIRPHQTGESKERSFGSSVEFESISSLQSGSGAASRVLLSSPFPSDAVPVPPGRSVRAFVALFVAVGLVVLGGSFWWLRAHDNPPTTSEPPSRSADSRSAVAPTGAPTTTSAPTTASAPTAAPGLAAKQGASPLSLAVEARRQSWIRTTVDGESDPGRTYAAGEKLQLNARHGISLRVGDAGAVYVSVNKGATAPLGQNGQVMTKQFVADAGSSDNGGSVPSGPVPAAPKPVAPPASLPTASNTATAPLPVPLVQSAAPQQNTAAITPTTLPAVARRDGAAAPPRSESANVAPSTPTIPAVAAPAAPPTVPPPASNGSPASAVVAAARQWLDAYHRQERSTMAALSTENLQLADERRAEERFPAGADVNRSLDRVSVQIAADTAVLTAVMTERSDAGERVSPISQVWIFSGGQWRVKQVRLVSEARLNQIFR
jgi:uncharacterized protein DUF4115